MLPESYRISPPRATLCADRLTRSILRERALLDLRIDGLASVQDLARERLRERAAHAA